MNAIGGHRTSVATRGSMPNHAAPLERRQHGLHYGAGSAGRASFAWLKEYGKDGPIAVFTLIAIASDLLLPYVWPSPAFEALPLYLALLVGGIPLLVGLVRQAVKLKFGSDWLAGISIVTATLLHHYLVACIVVLMLSGG